MPNVPNTLSDGSAYSISVSHGFVKGKKREGAVQAKVNSSERRFDATSRHRSVPNRV